VVGNTILVAKVPPVIEAFATIRSSGFRNGSRRRLAPTDKPERRAAFQSDFQLLWDETQLNPRASK
jgi:hypothetical protein